MTKEKKESEPSQLFGGTLNLFGLKIDLGELLESPESVSDRLQDLREKLKAAGGKEVLSEEEWKSGAASVSGRIRTSGILGEREFHVGTMGRRDDRRQRDGDSAPEVTEPPVDVFDEGEQITIVADVPGVTLKDLEIKITGSDISISTRAGVRRAYRKELHWETELEPDILKAKCNNGVLEFRVRKRSE